jgi:hypothetical protein
MEQKEFGFEIKIGKPIEEYTGEELYNLFSDAYMLEEEVERLRAILEKEIKRRNP